MLESNHVMEWDCIAGVIVGDVLEFKESVIAVDFCNGQMLVFLESGLVKCGCRSVNLDSSIVSVCKNGSEFYIMTADSSLNVLDSIALQVKERISEKAIGAGEHGGFAAVACSASGNDLILTGRNKSMRVVSIDSGQIVLRFKLQDVVEKFIWKSAGFSQHMSFDATFIYAAASAKGRHVVNIWESSTGNVIHRLEGPQEEVNLALWSPIKPQLYTVGKQTGKIFVWGPQFPQKWAALVPNIEAIETNIEYIEREDEFDLPVEEEIRASRERDEATELDLASFEPPKQNRITRYPLW